MRSGDFVWARNFVVTCFRVKDLVSTFFAGSAKTTTFLCRGKRNNLLESTFWKVGLFWVWVFLGVLQFGLFRILHYIYIHIITYPILTKFRAFKSRDFRVFEKIAKKKRARKLKS